PPTASGDLSWRAPAAVKHSDSAGEVSKTLRIWARFGVDTSPNWQPEVVRTDTDGHQWCEGRMKLHLLRHARARGRGRLLGFAIAAILAAGAALVGGKVTALADSPGWYQVQSSIGLYEHSGPGTGYSVVGGAPAWSWLNLDCSTRNDLSSVNGDPIWDHIA